MDNIFEYSTLLYITSAVYKYFRFEGHEKTKASFFANEFVISLSMQRVLMGNQKELSLLFDEPLISVDNVRESTRLNGAL